MIGWVMRTYISAKFQIHIQNPLLRELRIRVAQYDDVLLFKIIFVFGIVSDHIELTVQNVSYFGTQFHFIFKNEAIAIWHTHNTN